MMPRSLLLVALLAATACGRTAAPADLSGSDACTFCRMAVSDARFAAQVAAPGEEPRFFDDIGCAAGYLKDHRADDAAVFVADHRTRRWVPASDAVYTRARGLTTPMGSGLIAHADQASRDADPDARGEALTVTEVFGAALPGRAHGR